MRFELTGRFQASGFQDQCNKPLCQLSMRRLRAPNSRTSGGVDKQSSSIVRESYANSCASILYNKIIVKVQ